MTPHNTDTAAALRTLGWLSPDTTGLHLDTTGSSELQLGRAWSAHDTWTSTQTPCRLSALLVTEGTCLITHDTRESWVDENQLILLDSTAATRISVFTPTVRYLWHLDTTAPHNALTQLDTGAALPVSRHAWLPLTSLTDALFTASPAMADSSHTARSIEHLLLALLLTTPDPTDAGDETVERLGNTPSVLRAFQGVMTPSQRW